MNDTFRSRSRRLWSRCRFDTDAASELAALAADYIERGDEMPLEMRAWLADALRKASKAKPDKNGEKTAAQERAATLVRELGLVGRQGAPKFVDRRLVRIGVQAIAGGYKTETAVAHVIAKEFGVSLNTARSRIRKEQAVQPSMAAQNWFSSIMDANDIESLVCRRR